MIKSKKPMSLSNLFIKFICLVLIINLPIIRTVYASDLDQPLSSSDKALFKQMFKPLFTIYNMFKFLASIVGAVFLSWGALSLITSGDDFKKREMAKARLTFTVIGMLVVWGIPYFIEMVFIV